MARPRPAAARWLAPALAVLALLPPLGVLWWLARPLAAFVEDDALISLRYARRLLDGHGLTWNAGETVEGYSNLLWVLSSAAIGAAGVDLITAVHVLGVACTAGCLWSLLRIAPMATDGAEGRVWAPALSACAAGVWLCASGPIALWSVGGLEQPMVAMLLLAAAAIAARLLVRGDDGEDRPPAHRRDVLSLGAALSLLVWTRPDSPLFVALFAVALALAAPGDLRARLRLSVRVTAMPLAAFVLQLLFRLFYHGDVLPNPAYLKAGFAPERFDGGLAYLAQGARYLWPLWVLAAVAAADGLRDRRRRAWTALALASIVVWSAYVAAIGGDHFPGHRHLVVVVALCAALIASAVASLVSRAGPPWVGPVLFVALLSGAYGHARLQQRDPDYTMGIRARWQWDGKALGEAFATAFADAQPLWAVTAAGCMPYFSGLPALDMLGLNDRHIARQPPDRSLPLAHDHGDGAYVLDREPDLITFGLPVGGPPIYLSGRQMKADPRFARDYRPVQFRALRPHLLQSLTYVRLEGSVGMRSDDRGLRYPAYLLTRAVGHPLRDGSMGGLLGAGARTWTVPLTLPAGDHRVTIEPDNPRIATAVQAVEGEVAVVASPSGPRLRVGEGARVRIGLHSPRLDTLLRELRIEPVVASAAAATPVAKGAQLVLRQPPPGREANDTLWSLDFEGGSGAWKSAGDAMVVTAGPVRGQQPIVGARGKLLNSFVAGRGDRATGTLTSPPLSVKAGDELHVRIGGGRARAFHTQVGLAIVEGGLTRQVLTGRNREQLSRRAVDLSPYAGAKIQLRIFDHARGPWGHVLVDDLVVRRQAR